MPDSRKLGFIALAVAVVVTVLFFVLAPAEEKETGKVHVVTIRAMHFEPAKVEIAAGDSVKWVNSDIYLHATKSTDPKNAWQSQDMKPQESWTKKFTHSGTQPYICPYHPTMAGEIVIVAAPASGK